MWINWPDYVRVLLEYCASCLLSGPTCVMYYIGYLSLSGYNIVLLRWSPVVPFAVPPLTFVISAAQCRFWQCVGCCVLLRGVSSWPLGHVKLLCSEGPFRWSTHRPGMISLLICVPC